MKIMEFQTAQEAQTCLDAIHNMAEQYWVDQGYHIQVINGTRTVIGKRQSDGTDQILKSGTIKWDDVRVSPDNTFWFTSLSTHPQFTPALADLAQAFTFTEKDYPAEWDIEE